MGGRGWGLTILCEQTSSIIKNQRVQVIYVIVYVSASYLQVIPLCISLRFKRLIIAQTLINLVFTTRKENTFSKIIWRHSITCCNITSALFYYLTTLTFYIALCYCRLKIQHVIAPGANYVRYSMLINKRKKTSVWRQ